MQTPMTQVPGKLPGWDIHFAGRLVARGVVHISAVTQDITAMYGCPGLAAGSRGLRRVAKPPWHEETRAQRPSSTRKHIKVKLMRRLRPWTAHIAVGDTNQFCHAVSPVRRFVVFRAVAVTHLHLCVRSATSGRWHKLSTTHRRPPSHPPRGTLVNLDRDP